MTEIDLQGNLTPQIPRDKRWGGPLVMPPTLPEPGGVVCKRCARKWATTCTCQYYRRTTTFIDVLQSEWALKAWDRRMVAYGMGQRPDLVVAAAASQPAEGNELQRIADAAKEHALASAGANIGTALHRFTERIDTGRPLGHVPQPYPADINAYLQATADVEWVAVENFRVNDTHKVAGTADRIGWYKGQLHIFDLKSSPNDNAVSYPHGPAMQLAMYAHSQPYDIATDTRVDDPAPVDKAIAYIISLPAGKAQCRLVPIDIRAGWAACGIATKVWAWRDTKDLILDADAINHPVVPETVPLTFGEQVAVTNNLVSLRTLWDRARHAGALDEQLRAMIIERAQVLWTGVK